MFLILHLEEIREAGRILTGQTQEIEIHHFLIKGTVFDFHLSQGVFVSQVIYAFHTLVSQYILT